LRPAGGPPRDGTTVEQVNLPASGTSSLASAHVPAPLGLRTLPVAPRLWLALCGVLAVTLTNSSAGLGVQLGLTLVVAAAARRLVPLVASWRAVLWVCASLLIVYSLVRPSAEHLWLFGREGFFDGLLIAVRLLCFVSILTLLVLTTGQVALVRWAGTVNEDLGIMLSLTLSVLPVMRQQLDATLAAQQARGLRLDGNLLARLRTYLALLIPVVVKSLVRADSTAALLHVRGHGTGRRTRARRTTTLAAALAWAVGPMWIAGTLLTRFAQW